MCVCVCVCVCVYVYTRACVSVSIRGSYVILSTKVALKHQRLTNVRAMTAVVTVCRPMHSHTSPVAARHAATSQQCQCMCALSVYMIVLCVWSGGGGGLRMGE